MPDENVPLPATEDPTTSRREREYPPILLLAGLLANVLPVPESMMLRLMTSPRHFTWPHPPPHDRRTPWNAHTAVETSDRRPRFRGVEELPTIGTNRSTRPMRPTWVVPGRTASLALGRPATS